MAFLDAWTNQPFAFRNDYSDTTLEAELASVRDYDPRGPVPEVAERRAVDANQNE